MCVHNGHRVVLLRGSVIRVSWRAYLSHAGKLLEAFSIKAAVQVFHCQPPQALHTTDGAPGSSPHAEKVIAVLYMQLCRQDEHTGSPQLTSATVRQAVAAAWCKGVSCCSVVPASFLGPAFPVQVDRQLDAGQCTAAVMCAGNNAPLPTLGAHLIATHGF